MKKKYFKLFAAVLFLLCFSFSSFCEESKSGESSSSQNSEITLTTDQSQVKISEPSGNPSAEQKQPSTVWLFIRMILVLAVVIACIYAVVYLMKRGMKPGAENDPFLRKVSQITLSPGKTVQIVTLIDHAYIIGVTDNAVNLIGSVDDKELVDSMNLYADKNAGAKKPRSFADVLDIFMPNGPREKSNSVFGNSAKNAADILKKQREQLNPEEEK